MRAAMGRMAVRMVIEEEMGMERVLAWKCVTL
jgi:hypothetical protein